MVSVIRLGLGRNISMLPYLAVAIFVCLIFLISPRRIKKKRIAEFVFTSIRNRNIDRYISTPFQYPPCKSPLRTAKMKDNLLSVRGCNTLHFLSSPNYIDFNILLCAQITLSRNNMRPPRCA